MRIIFRLLGIIIYISIVISQSAKANETDQLSKLKIFFTTPIERRQLDEFRNAGKFENKQADSSGSIIRLQPLKVEVKGVVFREKGKPVVWVNEGNTLKSKKIDEDIRVRTKYVKQKNLKVPLKVDDKSLRMRPGQVWLETEGKIKDKYQMKQVKTETKVTENDVKSGDNNNNNSIEQAKAIDKVIKNSTP